MTQKLNLFRQKNKICSVIHQEILAIYQAYRSSEVGKTANLIFPHSVEMLSAVLSSWGGGGGITLPPLQME
jgi:hypothetical protein